MDLGVHCIELAEYVLDEKIIDAKGFCSNKIFDYEVEDGAVIIFKTQSGTLGHIDVNFNIPDAASESKFEIYGSKGYLICKGTLAQEEVGQLAHLYSPQGDYNATQNRITYEPEFYNGENGNLYLKQISNFCKLIEDGDIDYSCADTAVHVQEIVDKIYNEK